MDKGIMQLTEHSMWLIVLQAGAEADLVRLKAESKGKLDVQLPPLRLEGRIMQDNLPLVTAYLRLLLRALNLDFFLVRGIVIQPPQKASGSIILSGHDIAERQEGTVLSYRHGHLVVGQRRRCFGDRERTLDNFPTGGQTERR